MASENNHDDRQRHCEHQSDRPPKPSPEGRRYHYSHRRQAGRVSLNHRFDNVAGNEFERQKYTDRPQRHRPARVDGNRQRQRKDQAKNWTDEGDETKNSGKNAPYERTRNSNKKQPQAYKDTKCRVESELAKEQSAQAACGVIHGSSRVWNVGRPGQADQPIAKVLTLDKNEDNEHDDDHGRGERAKERVDQRAENMQKSAPGFLHLDRNGRLLLLSKWFPERLLLDGLLLAAPELLAQILENLLRSL